MCIGIQTQSPEKLCIANRCVGKVDYHVHAPKNLLGMAVDLKVPSRREKFTMTSVV